MSNPSELIENMLGMVERFNVDLIGLPIPTTPQRLDVDRKEWACIAFNEEVQEFFEAETMEDEADACLDLVYFALGRLVEMGLAPLPLFTEVHRANMDKKRGELSKRPASRGFDAVKPEGWTPPNLQPLLLINWAETLKLANEQLITESRQRIANEEGCTDAKCSCKNGEQLDLFKGKGGETANVG